MSHNKSISKVHGIYLYKQRELECASRSEEVMEEIELLHQLEQPLPISSYLTNHHNLLPGGHYLELTVGK